MHRASFAILLAITTSVFAAAPRTVDTTTSSFDPYAYELKTVKCPTVDHLTGKNLTIQLGGLQFFSLNKATLALVCQTQMVHSYECAHMLRS